ncbi:hypothetical protein ACFL42_01805 [Candidatus Omnitrophota bacterium]
MRNKTLLILALLLITAVRPLYPDIFRYSSGGKRDPFVPIVGITEGDMGAVIKLEDVVAIDEIILEGIAVGAGGNTVVIMNGELMRERQKRGGIVVEKITEGGVDISLNEQSYSLKFKKAKYR